MLITLLAWNQTRHQNHIIRYKLHRDVQCCFCCLSCETIFLLKKADTDRNMTVILFLSKFFYKKYLNILITQTHHPVSSSDPCSLRVQGHPPPLPGRSGRWMPCQRWFWSGWRSRPCWGSAPPPARPAGRRQRAWPSAAAPPASQTPASQTRPSPAGGVRMEIHPHWSKQHRVPVTVFFTTLLST